MPEYFNLLYLSCEGLSSLKFECAHISSLASRYRMIQKVSGVQAFEIYSGINGRAFTLQRVIAFILFLFGKQGINVEFF